MMLLPKLETTKSTWRVDLIYLSNGGKSLSMSMVNFSMIQTPMMQHRSVGKMKFSTKNAVYLKVSQQSRLITQSLKVGRIGELHELGHS